MIRVSMIFLYEQLYLSFRKLKVPKDVLGNKGNVVVWCVTLQVLIIRLQERAVKNSLNFWEGNLTEILKGLFVSRK